MSTSNLRSRDEPPPVSWVVRLLGICGSVHVALGLLMVLAIVLAWATLVEKSYGEDAARFGIYGTWWFTVLGFLLAINILAALLVRFPWKRRQLGFVVAHVGLLVLLAGCLTTRWAGTEAMLPLYEHRSESLAYRDSDHFQLELLPEEESGEAAEHDGPILVPFNPGPFNWDDYRRLGWFPWQLARRNKENDVLYDRDGIRLEVLDYCASANVLGTVPRVKLRVTPATGPAQGVAAPAEAPSQLVLSIRLEHNPHGQDSPYGMGDRRALPGGQQIVFWMASSAEETAAFLASKPDGPLGKEGRVVLYAGGRNYQWTADEWKPGQRRRLGTTGLEAEMVAVEPKLGGVRLLIHGGKGAAQPVFLASEFPEFCRQDYRDGVFGTYWRSASRPAGGGASQPGGKDAKAEPTPQDAARPRIDILAGEDQELYLRAWRGGRLETAGPLSTDVELRPQAGVKVFAGSPEALELLVEDFAPSSTPDLVVRPAALDKMGASPYKRQVRVQLTVDDTSERFWLGNSSDDPMERFHGNSPPPNLRKVVQGNGRRVAITLRPDQIDLGLEVKLRDAQQRLDPGSNRPAHYASVVDFLPRADMKTGQQKSEGKAETKWGKGLPRTDVTIKMNSPADIVDPRTGRSYRLFQSGLTEQAFPTRMLGLQPTDKDEGPIHVSYLSVNHDPGRMPKYAGCLLIVAGIFLRYYVRTGPRRNP
jgi:hypothetical protein